MAAASKEVHKVGNARWYLKNKSKVMEAGAEWRRLHPEYTLWLYAKKSAKPRGLEFSITKERVAELLEPMRCSATGHVLSWTWNGPDKNPWRPSLDRIDNDLGYTEANVRVVCWIYNLCKNTWPDGVVERFRSAPE